MILRQGKQIITMNFIPFIGALPILGGGGVRKRLPGWFWTNLFMIIFLKEMRPKKGQIKDYIFERKVHSFQILFQRHLLVLRRKVSPEEEAPSVWKIKSVCLEKFFLEQFSLHLELPLFFSLLSWTAHMHCFGSQTVIVSVLQLLFVFLCPLWHWPRWKLVVIVFFGTAKRTARLISQWVCGKTRKVGLLSTFL